MLLGFVNENMNLISVYIFNFHFLTPITSYTKPGMTNTIGGGERAGPALPSQPSLAQYQHLIRQPRRRRQVLFNEQDGLALRFQLAEQTFDLAYHGWRQTLRGLIKEQDAAVG